MSALGNGPPTLPATRQRQGACYIWQMLGPQMSAARAPIARRADTVLRRSLRLVALVAEDTAELPASALNSDVATAIPGDRPNSRAATAVTPVPSASPGYCARVPMRVASFSYSVQVRSRYKNPRFNRVPLEAADRETCMKDSSSTSQVR